MHKVPQTIRQQHCPSRRVVVPVAPEVLGALGALAWAVVLVEQGHCSRKTVLDSWAAHCRNLSGTSRQLQLD